MRRGRNLKDFVRKNKIELFLVCLVVLVFLLDGFMQFPILTDNGLFSYIGQGVADGKPVYSTAPDIKGPMIYLIDGFFIYLFSFLPNWLAIRTGMLLVSIALILLFYNVVVMYFKNKRIAFYASIILLSFDFFIGFASIGEPKIIAMFFQLFCLYFIYDKEYFLSGAAAALAMLSWQPAGLIIVVPFLFYLLNDRRSFLKKISKIIVGFLVPVAIIALYFIFSGTFSNFIEFTFLFPSMYKSLAAERIGFSEIPVIFGYYNTELIFMAIGILGALYYGIKKLNRLLSKGKRYILQNSYATIFCAPFILLFLYTVFDIVSGDDLFVFLPMIVIINAFVFNKSIKFITKKFNTTKRVASLLVIMFILLYGFFSVFQPLYPENPILMRSDPNVNTTSDILNAGLEKYGPVNIFFMGLFRRLGEEGTIEHQLEVANYIRENTNEDDKILSLSAPEILFLAGRENANKYPLIESYAFHLHLERNNEFDEFKANIKNVPPKYIILEESSFSKEPMIIEILELSDLIEEEYVRIDFVKYSIYERKD